MQMAQFSLILFDTDAFGLQLQLRILRIESKTLLFTFVDQVLKERLLQIAEEYPA